MLHDGWAVVNNEEKRRNNDERLMRGDSVAM
jgi:hypothetical protein